MEEIEEEKLIATLARSPSFLSALIEQLYNYTAVSRDILCFQHMSARSAAILCPIRPTPLVPYVMQRTERIPPPLCGDV